MENTLELMENIELNNNFTNDKIKNEQEGFLQTTVGKAINTAMDIGIRIAVPDLIEKQVIAVKNTILENGFSAGIKEAINSSIELGKSAIGIFTGKFEDVNQAQRAVEKGGILDTVSKKLDTSIANAKKNGSISNNIATAIKKEKNTLIKEVKNNIENTFEKQVKALEKVNHYCETWNLHYQNKDFQKMDYAYKNLEKNLETVFPIEATINEAKRIETLHNLIKNNGKDFNITEHQVELAEKLAEI